VVSRVPLSLLKAQNRFVRLEFPGGPNAQLKRRATAQRGPEAPDMHARSRSRVKGAASRATAAPAMRRCTVVRGYRTPAACGVLNPRGSTRICGYDRDLALHETRMPMRFPAPQPARSGLLKIVVSPGRFRPSPSELLSAERPLLPPARQTLLVSAARCQAGNRRSRSLKRWTLPVRVRGRSSTYSTSWGYW
jgi:hypothetical protein